LNRSTHWHLWRLLALLGGLSAATLTAGADADAVSAVQLLREGGCGGTLPAAQRLYRNTLLDRAAEQWAAGSSLGTAAERSGYRAQATVAFHIRGPESSAIELLRRSSCRTLMDRGLHDLGIYHRGADTYLVLASVYVGPAGSRAPVLAGSPPPAPVSSQPPAPIISRATAPSASRAPVPSSASAPLLAARALELVNEVRARGTRCGERSFGPVPPVKSSGTLANVALGHALDMAQHNYFEHEDLAGRSPADRVRAVGYREKLVGENIAYGPKSTEEVVQGWLDSPGHCENIMDPRFAEMGIAYAPGQASKRGLYWVQLLAAPTKVPPALARDRS
jgi:uncharacterized protein YkwD